METLESWFGITSEEMFSSLASIGFKLCIAIAILIGGFWLSKMASRGLKRVLLRRDTDVGLVTFLSSLVGIILKILTIVTAITQLGVEMTSFVALIGAAGIAIGMAFSGTLSNFAGGVMILLFKPFKVGDLIRTDNEEGTVSEILIFNTILKTSSNKVVILANGQVANHTVINYTKSEKRRVEWSFNIAYGDDLEVAKNLLIKFGKEDKKILTEPESIFVALGELGDSSLKITVRAWAYTDDYWDVFYRMNERVYSEFGPAGLRFPLPEMEYHTDKS